MPILGWWICSAKRRSQQSAGPSVCFAGQNKELLAGKWRSDGQFESLSGKNQSMHGMKWKVGLLINWLTFSCLLSSRLPGLKVNSSNYHSQWSLLHPLYNSFSGIQETQDELTIELADLKDKYREVVELLRDAQTELKKNRKKSYPGIGKHSVSGMFPKTSHSSKLGKKTNISWIIIIFY